MTASEFLFPSATGRMLSRHTKLEDKLRSAMCAAGLIGHWEHNCGRCKHVEDAPDRTRRTCPKCGRALWPRPVASNAQFKDPRSTWGTLAYEATGDVRFVRSGRPRPLGSAARREALQRGPGAAPALAGEQAELRNAGQAR